MKIGNMPGEPYEGKWDYDGACDPLRDPSYAYHVETFTLGCWQWVRRVKNGQGKGLKKGRVQHRIKGLVSSPEDAHSKATVYCVCKQREAES